MPESSLHTINHHSAKTSLFYAILLLSSFAVHASGLPFFNESGFNLEATLKNSVAQNKNGVMIFFGTPDCPFCKRMKQNVLNQPEVQNYFQKQFNLVELNIFDTNKLTNFSGIATTVDQFSKSHRIRLTPTLIFFDNRGERVFKQSGIIADPQEFIWLGRYIARKGFEEESFDRYKRKKRTDRSINPPH